MCLSNAIGSSRLHSMDAPKYSASSLPLQVLLFFDGYYVNIVVVVEFFMMLFKSVVYHYRVTTMDSVSQFIFILLYCLLQQARLFIGSVGNKSEDVRSIQHFLVFSLFAIVAQGYFLTQQVLVLQLDVILMLFALILTFLETCFIAGVFTKQSRNTIIICGVLFFANVILIGVCVMYGFCGSMYNCE